MDDAPIWIRILYSALIAWIAFIVGRELVPGMLRRTRGSPWKRGLALLATLFLVVFLALALYCAMTGRISATRFRG